MKVKYRTLSIVVSNATNDKFQMTDPNGRDYVMSFSKTDRSFEPITINGKDAKGC